MRCRLGELFCGPGGIAWGAITATPARLNGKEYSIEHAWANDYDFDTCCTYSHNICNTPVDEQGKIENLDPTVYYEEVHPFARIPDSFKKIVVVKDNVIPWHDENGILYSCLIFLNISFYYFP